MNPPETPNRTDSWIGSKLLDRYQITRSIGEGGMGIVYEAEDLNLKRRVAIKRLNDRYANDRHALSLFVREALAASKIGHEHIIDVYDIDSRHSPPFMVLEYLDGSDLDDYVTSAGSPAIQTVARIVIQVCDALEAVHAQGIIHRDLKPDNIYLIRRGANPEFVKVIDFGVARFKTSLYGQLGPKSVPGQPIGTLQYMSPEQLQGAVDVDHRTDIYALGAVLYFSLTSNPPFNGDEYAEIAEKILNEPPPSIREFRDDLPAETISELDRIIAKALEKSREKRYSSALDFKRELWPFSDKLEYQYSLPPVPPRPSFLSRWAMPTSVAVLTGAVFALGTLAITRGWQSSQNRSTPIIQSIPSAAEPPSRTRRVTPSGPAEATPEKVTISINTEPAGARLFLDGNAVSNPFFGQISRDEKPHRIEARLHGYLTKRLDFKADKDQTLSIPLSLARKGGLSSKRQANARSRPEVRSIEKTTGQPLRPSEETKASEATPPAEPSAVSVPSPTKRTDSPVPPQPPKQPTIVPHPTQSKPDYTPSKWKTTRPLDEKVKIIR